MIFSSLFTLFRIEQIESNNPVLTCHETPPVINEYDLINGGVDLRYFE
jgi:hypothetical protein